MIAEALILFGQKRYDTFRTCLKKKSATKGLKAIITTLRDEVVSSNYMLGDPLLTGAMELSEEYPALVRICSEQFDRWIALFEKFLTKKKDRFSS